VTADYSRDAQCYPKIFDFSTYRWAQSHEGWCNNNDHSQFNCQTRDNGQNSWPEGALGVRFHYATRNDPNGNATGGGCNDYWWTGWTSGDGSDQQVIENFDRWSGRDNGDVEIFYKSSSASIGVPSAKRSCAEWYESGYNTTGSYFIDAHDGSSSYYTRCEMDVFHDSSWRNAKETCLDWYNAGSTTTGTYILKSRDNVNYYRTKCEMELHGGGWTKFKTIYGSSTACDGEFCRTPIAAPYVNNDCGWLFSKPAMENKGGLVMFREVNAPHKTFMMDWLYDGSTCDGDRFFRIVTADYSRDAQCYPKIFDFSSNIWTQSGDGRCNNNDHSQFNCLARDGNFNNWPAGAKGVRFHYATRNDPNGNANGGNCNDNWWTGWTSGDGSSQDVIENFDAWTSRDNGDVEIFYKSSSAGM